MEERGRADEVTPRLEDGPEAVLVVFERVDRGEGVMMRNLGREANPLEIFPATEDLSFRFAVGLLHLFNALHRLLASPRNTAFT